MRTLLCSLAILCGLFSGSMVAAAPAVIDYQGFLRDTQTGLPLNGQHDLVFRLYGSIAGPDSVWSEGHAAVTVDQGVFSVQLGREDGGHPFSPPMFQGGALFLEITVDAQIMSPRTQLVSVPYALSAQVAQQAARADTATTATFANHAAEADTAAYARVAGGGLEGDSLWAESEGNIQNTNAGRVMIGDYGPFGKLYVKGQTGAVDDILRLTGTYGLLFQETSPRDWSVMNSSASEKSFLRFRAQGTGGQDVTFEGGSVGIGTIGPQAKLDVEDSVDGTVKALVTNTSSGTSSRTDISAANGSNAIQLTQLGSNHPLGNQGWVYTSGLSNALVLGTVGAERMRIATNGNVGIGTTSPDVSLQLGSPSNPGHSIRVWQAEAASPPQMLFNRLNGAEYGVGTSSDDNFYISTYRGSDRTVILQNTFPNTKLNLLVRGDFCATGTKNAVVPTSQGMTKVYCDESTEVWFTDRGEGKTSDGTAHVDLDPLFLETVTVNAEHPLRVHVDVYGTDQVPKVRRGTTGFDVAIAGEETVEFSWRVEAKRKGYESDRLETLDQAGQTGR